MNARARLLPALVLSAAGVALPLPASAAQSLRGSHASVERMHRQAVQHDLHFYQTSAGIRRAAARRSLVRLRANRDYTLYRVTHPYVRSPVQTFVERLAAQYHRACGERLVITGAVRPATRQPWNASDRSVHPAGIAVDVRKPTSRACRSWLRRTLLSLERGGVIEATEEYGPPHFHVAVYPRPYTRYLARITGGRSLASADDGGASRYRVRAGDTLWEIAERNDISVDRLMSANELDGAHIEPGQTLVVPDGG
jgi:hypothetical protein